MLPTIVLDAEVDLDKRAPFRTLRFSDQMHAGFQRGQVGLLSVAPDAGAHNVLPRCGAAAIARDDMIEIQIFALKNMAAVLAGVAVAFEDVVTREFDLLFRQPVKHHQQDDSRNPDFEGNGGDGFRVRLLLGKIAPLVKTECLESAVGIAEDNLGVPFKHKSQRASRRANVDRLPEAVEHQHVLIEKGAHIERLRPQTSIQPSKVSTPVSSP
jgi:hypothetical protein